MSDPANEPLFRLEIAGLPEPFVVSAFMGSEAINEPFSYDVELLPGDAHLDLAAMLYRSVWLSFGDSGRGIHGQLHELVQHRHDGAYRVRIGPKLGCLAQRFNQRVFSARTVPQIIREVLKAHGIGGHDLCLDLEKDYPPLDYCTQYRESDLRFLQRLCAQASLHFHFEHGRAGHCLVIADGSRSFSPVREASYGAGCQAPGVHLFNVQTAACEAQLAEGRSDLMNLHCGQALVLSAHPFEAWNRRWLLTRVEHRGDAGGYGNHFHAVADGQPLAADRPSKPRMLGQQRGWVAAVDESALQMAGRVAVQFDWVYQGEGASPSHCWLPLAPELAACGPGAIDEGTEVLVSFIEGDPDRPMVSAFLGGRLSMPMENEAAGGAFHEPASSFGVDPVLLAAIQAAEPLILLCLLPGGGSFSPCGQPVCTCRLITQGGASSAP